MRFKGIQANRVAEAMAALLHCFREGWLSEANRR
jgi:hypothetical protein